MAIGVEDAAASHSVVTGNGTSIPRAGQSPALEDRKRWHSGQIDSSTLARFGTAFALTFVMTFVQDLRVSIRSLLKRDRRHRGRRAIVGAARPAAA